MVDRAGILAKIEVSKFAEVGLSGFIVSLRRRNFSPKLAYVVNPSSNSYIGSPRVFLAPLTGADSLKGAIAFSQKAVLLILSICRQPKIVDPVVRFVVVNVIEIFAWVLAIMEIPSETVGRVNLFSKSNLDIAPLLADVASNVSNLDAALWDGFLCPPNQPSVRFI